MSNVTGKRDRGARSTMAQRSEQGHGMTTTEDVGLEGQCGQCPCIFFFLFIFISKLILRYFNLTGRTEMGNISTGEPGSMKIRKSTGLDREASSATTILRGATDGDDGMGDREPPPTRRNHHHQWCQWPPLFSESLLVQCMNWRAY
jgi:hypothetical protein